MIKTSINYNGSKLTLGGYGFRKYQMVRLGQLAVGTVKARVAKGVGSNDAPMKPLAPGYAGWKRKIGLQPIRDLTGPGARTYGVINNMGFKKIRKIRQASPHMLDNFTVRYADAMTVRMDITAQWARTKARSNERRAAWFGFSNGDVRIIIAAAQRMFMGNVTDLAVRLRGQRGGAVWMDPLGLHDELLKKVA